jgi:hypothetical protein
MFFRGRKEITILRGCCPDWFFRQAGRLFRMRLGQWAAYVVRHNSDECFFLNPLILGRKLRFHRKEVSPEADCRTHLKHETGMGNEKGEGK